jgi:hypothetical protein
MTYDIDTSDLSLDFATDEVEVQATYELLPEGSYPVNLTKVEMKPTKAGNGKRLVVSCKVTDGQHKGRSLMTGLNVKNANPVAEEIGRKQLRVLLQSVNLDGERDMSRLIGKECVALVVIRDGTGGYGPSNDIKAFKPLSGGGSAPSQQASGPSGKKPSWV